MRKTVFRVFDKVQNKSGCTATEDGLRLDISDLESGIVLPVDCTMYVVKTDTDQQHGYGTADLSLCFCICKKQIFS